jgi:hypothetical protein
MKATTIYKLVWFAPLILAVICFWRSESVMNGYQDCRLKDSNIGFHPYDLTPLPSNCADSRTLMSHDMFRYCGIGLVILPIGVWTILFWKEERSNSDVVAQVKIVD